MLLCDRGSLLTLLLWLGLLSAPILAEEPSETSAKLTQEWSLLVQQLDAEDFEVRQQAQSRLRQWTADEALRDELAVRVHKTLLDARLSVEVRTALEALAARLPKSEEAGPPIDVSSAEVQRLIGLLGDEEFRSRLGARRRLELLAARPPSLWVVLDRSRHHLSLEKNSAETRRNLDRVYQRARRAWMAVDPRHWPARQVDEPTIERWVAALAQPLQEERLSFAQQTAQRELADVMLEPRLAQKAAKIITRRMDGVLDRPARARLEQLTQMALPGLVAEVWSGRKLVTIQYLLLGVPQHPEGAANVTLFDRADEKTAHCVSGNALDEGDYPIGVAITRPNHSGVIFHIQNMPTERDRLLYKRRLEETSEPQRLAAMTERTMQHLIKQRQRLDSGQLSTLLGELDAEALSQHVGDYLLKVKDLQEAADEPVNPFQMRLPFQVERASHHGRVCFVMAMIGTKSAAAGVIQAIEKEAILAPKVGGYDFAHLALLSIAVRDPWPEVETWLGQQISRQHPLMNTDGEPTATPDLGATAAAILLTRHEQKPLDYGLVELRHDLLRNLGCPGYRFAAEKHRAKALKWWEEVSANQAVK